METNLVVTNQFMPALSIRDVSDRRNALVEFAKNVMVKDVDYGAVPNTDKPTLLKPGAEKLCTLFGMTPRFHIVSSIMEWGADGKEPLFFYHYSCSLYRGDYLIAEGEGSCNSHEKKYRYRQAERVCPYCGKSTIIKGRAEYGGGWICFAKKGGCGAKFADSDISITGQQVGLVANPDVADLVNTICKMAQKRALIAAVLIGVNASEFFNQDLEDIAIEGSYTIDSAPPKQKPTAPEAGYNLVERIRHYWQSERSETVAWLAEQLPHYKDEGDHLVNLLVQLTESKRITSKSFDSDVLAAVQEHEQAKSEAT